MRYEQVDERDSSWECHDPVFRVYLFSGGGGDRSWTTDTYDVWDAEIDAVMAWAGSRAQPGEAYSIALRDGQGSGRGLIWLLGEDMNGEPTDERERAIQARMIDRIVPKV